MLLVDVYEAWCSACKNIACQTLSQLKAEIWQERELLFLDVSKIKALHANIRKQPPGKAWGSSNVFAANQNAQQVPYII